MTLEELRRNKRELLSGTLWEIYNSPKLGRKLAQLRESEQGIITSDLLTDLVGDTILGIYKTSELPQKLQSELGVGADTAHRIMSELSEFLKPVEDRERMEGEPDRSGLQELQQNFKALREEAIHGETQENSEEAAPPETPQQTAPTAPAPENVPTAHVISTPDTLNERPIPSAELPKAEPLTFSDELPSEVEAYKDVQPMRSMPTDVSRIHGYGAYRDLYPDEAGQQEHTEEVIRSASQEDLLTKKPPLVEKPTYTEE